MSQPNQSGIATFFIGTGTKLGGPQKITLPVASTGAQTDNVWSLSALPTVPVSQGLGEVNPALVQGTVSAGVPTAGAPPTPQPTVKKATAVASTGAQPSGTTPFAAFATNSTNPVPSASGTTPGTNV